jgi:hypothetical protein
LYILNILCDAQVPREVIAPLNLGKTRDPRPNEEAGSLFANEIRVVAFQQRARTDETHIALENIDELGEFV